jgi:chromosomal replication initiator protein
MSVEFHPADAPVRVEQPRLTVACIRNTVAKFYDLTPAQMQSRRRFFRISRPRQVAMYLARKLTRRSYPQIGRVFGDYDHTTIMHACVAVPKRAEMDRDLARDLALLEAALLNLSAGEGI